MTKFFTFLMLALSFSSSGMEKENLIHIREGVSDADAVEDRNADVVMGALRFLTPIPEITNLIETLPINFNSHIIIDSIAFKELYTIQRCALERCKPNNKIDVKFIELIIKKEASLRQGPSVFWQPYLCYATKNAIENNMNLTIVELLIDNGTDLNFRCVNAKDEGNSALHYALSNFVTNTKCIDYLLEKGADANAVSSSGYTPLAILVHRFDELNRCWAEPSCRLFERVVEKLLQHGAEINKEQECYDRDKKNFVKKSNYDLLKPLMPDLDATIKRVDIALEKAKDEKMKNLTVKTLADNLKKVPEEQKHNARLSIIVSGRKFNLHETILTIRCSKLFQLNSDY